MKTNKPIQQEENLDFSFPVNKENPFTVPENYFEFLPEKISSRLQREKTYLPVFFKPRTVFTSSLTVAAIIFLFFYFFPNHTNTVSENQLSEVEIQLICSDYDLYNIDENLITETFISLNNISELDRMLQNGFSANEEEVTKFLEESADINQLIYEL